MKAHHISLSILAAMALLSAGCGKGGPFNADTIGNMIGGSAGNVVKAGGRLANAAAISEKDEDVLGQSVGVALTNQYGVYNNDNALKYVTLVGLTVASASPNPGGNCVFGILDTDEVNALSGPNGYIFITRGLLFELRDEAELAGVLGHEMAHVCNHDGLKQLRAAEAQGAFADAMRAAGGEAERFATELSMGVDVLTKQSYTQPQEHDSDRLGVQMMSAAGYDPQSYLRFLQRLAASQGAAAGGRLMSTHPGVASRVAHVTDQLRSVKPGGATLADRFAANVQK